MKKAAYNTIPFFNYLKNIPLGGNYEKV